jgi:hypothetical protein
MSTKDSFEPDVGTFSRRKRGPRPTHRMPQLPILCRRAIGRSGRCWAARELGRRRRNVTMRTRRLLHARPHDCYRGCDRRAGGPLPRSRADVFGRRPSARHSEQGARGVPCGAQSTDAIRPSNHSESGAQVFRDALRASDDVPSGKGRATWLARCLALQDRYAIEVCAHLGSSRWSGDLTQSPEHSGP